MLHRTVKKFIESQHLLPEGSRVIVALSGGADSVALMDILYRLDYACIGAHVNFHLRGEESDRDAAFSHQVCRDLGVPFYKTDLYAAEYAEEEGISVEMAARELRYRWFEQLRKEQGAVAVAVAHHRDDSVETVLLNLIRGTGIRGLTGIKPQNGNIVRPLLCCDREDVLEYIQQRGLTFMTDRTNALNEYRRNKIRNEVLPLLESIQPSVRESIARTMDHLNETEVLYEGAIEDAKKRICPDWKKGSESTLKISISALEHEKVPQSLLYEILSEYGFGRLDVQNIWKNRLGGSGKIYFSHSFRLVFDRDSMLVTEIPPLDEAEFPLEEGQSSLNEPFQMHCQLVHSDKNFQISTSKSKAYLDADKLLFPLIIRHPRKGDNFIPFGMHGRKLISDYCIDRKMNALEKEELWLLCSGKDVVWVIGERIDNRFRIDETTKRIFQLSVNGF
ncbi:MAG TPA: tRNA lysidine(34) synthetase TilS [Bacteroidales bacterium]|nr:tRNA lysidine(34) synthetase TilS [Bacteroidales bacterium]